MQVTKPEIVFTFPIALGGVSSFNFNLINNSLLIKQFYTKVILLKQVDDNRPIFTEKFNVDEQIVFEYSDFENQYHLQKRLNVLLGISEGAIVTDNGLTVEAARRFNNVKTVFSLLHDDYYVNQQKKLADWADVAIAHASFFSDALYTSNPLIWSERVFYIPYGVNQLSTFPVKNNAKLNLVFLGRLEESKGVLDLIKIQKMLQAQNINVHWTIIGKGSLKNELILQWENYDIDFFEPNSTKDVYSILEKQDIFIFPTTFEGTPVAILEAMACGVVTIVNDLPGGIRDIVTKKTGFRCSINNFDEYVNAIVKLNSDKSLLNQMQINCSEISKKVYDVNQNSENYINLFLDFKKYKRSNKSEAQNLQKIDIALFPNWFTIFVRRLKRKL